MAGMKEIQNRIHSVQDTMKITNAMYMISSNKLRKAKKRLENTAPYFRSLQEMISQILDRVPDVEHRFFDDNARYMKGNRRRGYIVITADKGLAGSYNHNVLKLAQQQLDRNDNPMLFVVGEIGRQYFAKQDISIDRDFQYTAQSPSLHRARAIAEEMVTLYLEGELRQIDLIYTHLEHGNTPVAKTAQLLPLSRHTFTSKTESDPIPLYPSPKVALDTIAPDYVAGFLFGALVESFCSEQHARMIAMDAANKSAQDMIRALSIQYNRVRQAMITQEITEVIGGAKALRAQKMNQEKRHVQ